MRAIVVVIAVAVWLTALPGQARAHDSLAPPGASHNWLPDDLWVVRHWIPFDQRDLLAELGLTEAGLKSYLYNDHHTLAELARLRGMDPTALAARLVARWRGVSDIRRARLQDRTLRILTQGHLAQHVFFHVFHGLNLTHALDGVHREHGHHDASDLSPERQRQLRRKGRSYAELARRAGVPIAMVKSRIKAMLAAQHDEGIARKQAWPAQSAHILAKVRELLPCWLERPPPSIDDRNPFGKSRFVHGSHAAPWPATAVEKQANERRVERFRRSLRASCWPIPERWSWPQQAL